MELNITHEIPKGLLEVSIDKLDTVLSGPTLICLEGKKENPLFVSTLLHGNETSGFYAMQKLLKHYQHGDAELPRSLLFFIGNVAAAAQGLRHLPEQRDYNRIWAGGTSAEHKLAMKVLETATEPQLFASIDIHNNSGKNPFYGCVNHLDPRYLYLANLFSPTTVYFVSPVEVLSIAFAEHCPSVTIECGQPGNKDGIEKAYRYIDHCLHLEDLETLSAGHQTEHIYHTAARIKVPLDCTIGFGERDVDKDLSFIENIDHLNFTELEAGMLLGWRHNEAVAFSACDKDGVEKADQYFSYEGDEIRLKKPLVLSMLTKDIKVIHQDCFGYVMEDLG